MNPNIIFSNYDDPKNPFYAGGGAVAVHEVAKRLVKKGRSVTVVTSKYPGSKSLEVVDGVRYERIGWPYPGVWLAQLVFQLCLIPQVIFRKFDIWFESFVPPVGSPFLNIFSNKPIIGLVHMLPAKDMERKYHIPLQWLQRAVIGKRDRFIAVTEESKLEILESKKDAVVDVISNGINLPSKTASTKPKHILFMGRIEINQKGLDLLIEAYVKQKSVLPKLVIAGNGIASEVTRLRRLISAKKLENQVSVVGRVDGTKKSDLFRSSYCVVSPSRFETFSIVSLEAMSYKLPIVAFDIPGLSWLPDSASIKVGQFDTQKLGEALAQIVASQTLRTKLGNSGYSLAKTYTWTNVSSKFSDYIDQAMYGSDNK